MTAESEIIVGIDASNIRGGGGLTHLRSFLTAADPGKHGIRRLIVWSGRKTLDNLPDRTWLLKESKPELDRKLPWRVYWQHQLLREIDGGRCDLLFVPGGSYTGGFRPYVALSQNLLPFSPDDLARYGLRWKAIRLWLLKQIQRRTFERAAGIIFLTLTARNIVQSYLRCRPSRTSIVPHGIDPAFFCLPRPQCPLNQYSAECPFRWLYVSIVDFYKHQWHVADAVARLRGKGLPVAVNFVGPGYGPALTKLKRNLRAADPSETFLRYRGEARFETLHSVYHQADGFIFASSCENMPNILIEAMASGLPIACARRGPMPEILGEAGVYFDPENPADIAMSLETMVNDPALRERCSQLAYRKASRYSWGRCADETFQFLTEVAREWGRALRSYRDEERSRNAWKKNTGSSWDVSGGNQTGPGHSRATRPK